MLLIKPNLVTSIKKIAEICIPGTLTKHFAMYKYILHKCSKIKQPWTFSIKNNRSGLTLVQNKLNLSTSIHFNFILISQWPLTYDMTSHLCDLCTFHLDLWYPWPGNFWYISLWAEIWWCLQERNLHLWKHLWICWWYIHISSLMASQDGDIRRVMAHKVWHSNIN